MLAKKIGSVQHPIVKKALSLRKNRKSRSKYGQICILGKKFIHEIAEKFALDVLLSLHPTDLQAQEKYLVHKSILKKISGVLAPDEMLAILPMPKPQSLVQLQRILILDHLQDPGNLGTILRTALSFGWEGVYLTPNTVDLFNEKTLRASKGAVFHLPYDILKMDQIMSLKHKYHWNAFVADLHGKSLDTMEFPSGPICLVLGSEGSGPSSLAKKECTPLHIPIQNMVESLNVAIAGGIIMYALRPQ